MKTHTPGQDEAPFSVKALPYDTTPYPLFKKLRSLPLPVLLASGNDRGRKDTRFEIMTAMPDAVFRAEGETTRLTTAGGDTEILTGNPLAHLAARFPLASRDGQDPDLPFTGGAIGYLGYEMLHPGFRLPPAHARDIGLPDMLVGLYSWALVLDHDKRRCSLVFRRDCPAQTRRAVLDAIAAPVGKTSGEFRLTGEFMSNFTRDQYQEAYQRVIDYILAGDCYQVNLTQRFSAACQGDPYSAFTRLQTIAKAPFAAFMEDADRAVLSFSPERFIRVRDTRVMTQPIKGTRPRSADPAVDARNRHDLETSLKDRAENLMIVDLLRNDLGQICRTGSIAVPEIFETQSFTNVHHLVSTITGQLAHAGQVFDLLGACFPGGSITGTPKIRAMEIINELETVMRSVYCGAFLWIDRSGNMDSNICIRTLVKDGDRIHCWGGGGVVADSVGAQEYQESLDKITLFMDALRNGL